MRKLIVAMMVCGCITAFGSPTTVELLNRMENSTDTTLVTTTILNASTLGDLGTWSIPNANNSITVSTTRDVSIPGLQISGGSGYGDSGTRAWKVDCTTDDTYFQYDFDASTNKVSMGFALYVSGAFTGTHQASIDLFSFRGGGDNCVVNLNDTDSPATQGFSIETGGSNSGNNIPVNNGQWYWITMLYDGPNTTSTLNVYAISGQPSTWVLVGTSTATNINEAHPYFRVGRTDQHVNQSDCDVWMDDLAISATGVFPLLPGDTTPSGSTAFSGAGTSSFSGSGATSFQ